MKKSFTTFVLLFLVCAAAVTNAAAAGGVPQPLDLDLTVASDSGFSNKDNITRITMPSFTVNNIVNGSTVELLRDGVAVATVTGTAGSMTLTDPKAPSNAVCLYSVRQTLGKNSATSLPLKVILDNAGPTVTINQAAGQADPTATLPVRYTAVLSDPAPYPIFFNEESFVDDDVSTIGSSNRQFLFVQPIICDQAGTTCEIPAVAQIPGTIQLSVPAHVFTDLAGNWNLPSTSTDNVIDFQPLATTINFSGRVVRRTSAQIAPFPLTVLIFDTVTNETVTVRTNSAGYFRLLNHPFYAGTSRTMAVRVYNKSGQQVVFDAFGVQGDRFLNFIIQDQP